MADAYDVNAQQLVAGGYFPLPIGPGTKKPQLFVPSLNKFQDMRGWALPHRRPETSGHPGAGVGVRLGKQTDGTYVVALDWDDDEAAVGAMDTFPSTVTKEGARGYTAFYKSTHPVPTRDFRVNGRMAVQVLSDGRQTVVPPTIHPDTGRAYTWTSEFDLYNVPVTELPALPDDYVTLIEAVLRPLGYEPEPEKPVSGNGHDADADNPFQELNTLALKNLPLWVPDLQLYGCRRCCGRYASYEAVATWRPSSTGRPVEQRKHNLKIIGRGIKDFGTNQGYSPIDLVMRARGCERPEAMTWLEERVRPDKGPAIDFDALAKSRKVEEPKPTDQPQKNYKFQLVRFNDLRLEDEVDYLVEGMIPRRGIAVLWGKKKSLKSFILLDMVLHVARGQPWYERSVTQGHVVYCAFEGGHGYGKRWEALRSEYQLEDELVSMQLLRVNANLITDHKILIRDIRGQVKEKFGDVTLVTVVLDTLNKSLHGSENKDVDMAAYVRAAEAIRDAFDCIVIIVHHCGWDESRPRGHSSLGGAVDAELSAVRDSEHGDLVTVEVQAMRDGPEGARVVGRRKVVEVGVDRNGRPITTVVIEHVDDDGGDTPTIKRVPWPASLKVFYRALLEALLGFGFDHRITDGPTVKAVDVEYVSEIFCKTYVVKSEPDSTPREVRKARANAFSRALDKAQRLGLIAARVEGTKQLVWSVSQFDGGSYAL
jgi:AAA domain/Bifunctional DNA primase/polymerase, N-terminal